MKKYWILTTAIILFLIGLSFHFIYNGMFSAGEYVIDYFAAGDFAIGVFAAGKFSIGIFSAGIFSIGIFSIGIFNIGLYAIGLFVFGYKKKLPNVFLSSLKQVMRDQGTQKITKTLFVLMFLGALGTVNAQNSNNVRIIGGFGGPLYQLSTVDAELSRCTGGGGAAVFRSGLFIGGYGLETSHNSNTSSTMPGYEIEKEYDGLWIGYIKRFKKGFELSTSLRNGWGEVKLVNYELQQTYFDKIHVITPDVTLSKRFLTIAWISVGVFYNQFFNVDMSNYANSDFSSLGGSVSLKFGFY